MSGNTRCQINYVLLTFYTSFSMQVQLRWLVVTLQFSQFSIVVVVLYLIAHDLIKILSKNLIQSVKESKDII